MSGSVLDALANRKIGLAVVAFLVDCEEHASARRRASVTGPLWVSDEFFLATREDARRARLGWSIASTEWTASIAWVARATPGWHVVGRQVGAEEASDVG
jgi:hypothetical protein